MARKVRSWIYNSRPESDVSKDNYKLVEEDIDFEPASDELVVEAHYWSVDPYMRIQQSQQDTWEAPHPLGAVQQGGVIGRVIDNNGIADFTVGDWVNCYMGWRTHGVVKADKARKLNGDNASAGSALHVLGMPGRIAYFGLVEAGKPEKGNTILVSGAAGAVGHIVGQIKGLETVWEGFEKLPDALSALFTGANTGKMIVKR